MTLVKLPVVLVTLNFLWTFTRGVEDTHISCGLRESCILPCSFQAGDDVVIHWIQLLNTPAHSFYHDQDQLGLQDQHFRGRTSLFKDQISRGNASLQLTGLNFLDEGRYKCYTSTITGNRESFINLNVDVLVQKVNIKQVENKITCSSEGIYPEPELTWSTSPLANVTFTNRTTVQQTEQQLFDISSSLIRSESHTDLTFSCTVSTRRSRRKATLLKSASIAASSTTTIPCNAPNPPLTTLIWRFNHSRIILNSTIQSDDVSYTASEEWMNHVEDVSESGGLTLTGLSLNQEGIYTCELSNAEETLVTNTILQITEEKKSHIAGIVVGVLGGAVVSIAVTLLIRYCKSQKNQRILVPASDPSAVKPEVS